MKPLIKKIFREKKTNHKYIYSKTYNSTLKVKKCFLLVSINNLLTAQSPFEILSISTF